MRREAPLPVRRAVVVLQDRCRASEHLVCRVVVQHRSTQRHGCKGVNNEEAKLRQRLREIAFEHIRWGRCMAFRCLAIRAVTARKDDAAAADQAATA